MLEPCPKGKVKPLTLTFLRQWHSVAFSARYLERYRRQSAFTSL
jgi:hypothetical protein